MAQRPAELCPPGRAMPRVSACGSRRRPPEPSSPGAGETPPLHHDRPARRGAAPARGAARSLAAGLLLAFVGLFAAAGPAQSQTVILPEFTAEFTDANGNAVERLLEGESFGVRVSITNGVTFTEDKTVTVNFVDGHHDEDSTVIDGEHPNDYLATSLPSATLVAGTTSVQLGTATLVNDGFLEPLEAFHAVVTLDGRSTEVSLLIEDDAATTGPIDLYFDEGNTIELHKPDTFDDRIDLALRLQNGDSCYVGFPFTTLSRGRRPRWGFEGVVFVSGQFERDVGGRGVGRQLRRVHPDACHSIRDQSEQRHRRSEGSDLPRRPEQRGLRGARAAHHGRQRGQADRGHGARPADGPERQARLREGVAAVGPRPPATAGTTVDYNYEQNGSGT